MRFLKIFRDPKISLNETVCVVREYHLVTNLASPWCKLDFKLCAYQVLVFKRTASWASGH